MYIVPFEKEPSVTAFVPFSVVQWSKYSIIKITSVIFCMLLFLFVVGFIYYYYLINNYYDLCRFKLTLTVFNTINRKSHYEN